MIQLNPMDGSCITYKTGSIIKKEEINKLRKFIENYDYKGQIEWWSKKLGIIHKTITISYGPILREWIKRYNSTNRKYNKEETC